MRGGGKILTLAALHQPDLPDLYLPTPQAHTRELWPNSIRGRTRPHRSLWDGEDCEPSLPLNYPSGTEYGGDKQSMKDTWKHLQQDLAHE